MNFTVELDARSYDIVVREGAREQLAALIAERAPRAKNAALVTSPSLAQQVWFDLKTGLDQCTLLVPEGESAKTASALEELLESFAELRLSRDDVVVAVGGGAITDLVGFAAAVYLRGVALIHVPTSLVAQVDAAVGGKTGINLAGGKNLAGAFYQPLGVLCDTSVLTTLPERERRSGLGEVAKCWLLEARDVGDLGDLGDLGLTYLIDTAVGLKVAMVVADEREGGRRVLLNYGHTLAHALEKLALRRGVDELRHGEAVAIGLAFAARLARALDRVGDTFVRYHDDVLDALGLEGRLPDPYDLDELIEAMTFDKKARHDLSFVLGGPKGYSLVSGIERSVIADALERFKGEV
ncbi:MAG: 3-dehydroquinate synthase family protein [Acidimicrobiales bacterium]